MDDLITSEQNGSLSVRRAVALALVGVLLMSAVGGVIGSSGLAAAQQGGTGGNTTTAGNATAGNASGGATNSSAANPVNATIQEFRQKLGYENRSAEEKQNIRTALQELNEQDLSQSEQDKRINTIKDNLLFDREILGIPMDQKPQEQKQVEDIISKHLGSEGGFATYGTPNSSSGIDIPNLVDQKLRAIADSFKKGAADTLGTIYNLAFSTPVPENDGWNGIFGEPTNATGSGQNETNTTNRTGSPQNATNATGSGQNGVDSWQQVLGISSDRTFQQLHQQLLMDKLYPVLNYVLGIGVVVLGLSLVVNPLMSRFRVINLMTKFVTFLFLYAFSWGAITLMHGVVNDITMWLRPTSAELQSLVTSVDKIGAASAAAYFVGSGGILSSVFGMGLELAVRHLALVYFFPYVFPVLVLILYLSPWQRLKQFASMGIWQYVNVLTMVIPMAVFLKAALIIDFSPTDGIGGMIVLGALFVLAVVVPVIQTYFFIQIPGTAAWAAKSAGSAAASRIGAAKEKVWGSDDSSADSTATGNTSPGDRADEAVETTSVSSSSSNSGVPSSGELSDSALEQTGSDAPETTAAKVRALDEQQHSDPNSADAKYEAYFETEDRPRRTTMNEKLAD